MRGWRPSSRGELGDGLAGPGHRGAGARLLRVHTGDDADPPGVAPEHLLQRVGDLPHRRLRPGRGDRQGQQVVLVRPGRALGGGRGGVRQRGQRGVDRALVALLAQPAQLVELLRAHAGVVDPQDVDLAVGRRTR